VSSIIPGNVLMLHFLTDVCTGEVQSLPTVPSQPSVASSYTYAEGNGHSSQFHCPTGRIAHTRAFAFSAACTMVVAFRPSEVRHHQACFLRAPPSIVGALPRWRRTTARRACRRRPREAARQGQGRSRRAGRDALESTPLSNRRFSRCLPELNAAIRECLVTLKRPSVAASGREPAHLVRRDRPIGLEAAPNNRLYVYGRMEAVQGRPRIIT